MNKTNNNSKKLLFVFSKDHGELFNAYYFLTGSPCSAYFLMPENLYNINKNTDLYPVLSYKTPADIYKAIAFIQPDIILLFSGYLFVENKIFSYEQFKKFIERICSYQIPVITSDPWLKIGQEISVETNTLNRNDPAQNWFFINYNKIYNLLKSIKHINTLPVRQSKSKASDLSFFNNKLKFTKSHIDKLANKYSFKLNNNNFKYWLFIISQQDYQLQINQHGEKHFISILWRLLRETSSFGRKAILIAPKQCQEIIKTKISSINASENIHIYAESNYIYYILLLFSAEYVFYWNMLSASFALRIINKKPVFFFAPGHVLESFAPFKLIALNKYYPGIVWPQLNQNNPLQLKTLKELAGKENKHYNKIIKSWNNSPNPFGLIKQLLAK